MRIKDLNVKSKNLFYKKKVVLEGVFIMSGEGKINKTQVGWVDTTYCKIGLPKAKRHLSLERAGDIYEGLFFSDL